jgi:putative DNA methylase
LEAQRLGLEAFASDLNPVAVLINKAMIEIPPRFSGQQPVNPTWQEKSQEEKAANSSHGANGIAEDLRYYGKWMRDEAERRIGHLYPKIEITAEMVKARPDLKPLVGQKLKVIAWLWARTVKSPNPAFAKVNVPLVSTFTLSMREGKEAYVQPVVKSEGYCFTVKVGNSKDAEAAKSGTKLARGANFQCVMSGTPIQADYIRSEALAGRMGTRLMAIVAEGKQGRVYLAPNEKHEAVARTAQPIWKPELKVPTPCHDVDRLPMYGMPTWGDAFTPRQLVALTTFADLVQETRDRVKCAALAAGLSDTGKAAAHAGTSASAYADALGLCLAFAVSKMANIGSSIASWMSDRGAFRETFARQAIQMVWDFAESNTFADAGGSFAIAIEKGAMAIAALPASVPSVAVQADAALQTISTDKVVSTDPPYYDNISYADLSDFFYVWLRRSLKPIFPDLFATLAVPKEQELIAASYRHGGKGNAEAFFLEGMTQAMRRLAAQSHPAFPVTIFYAFKQSESSDNDGTTNTGWDTFLAAVIEAGFAISGTWPMRTEGSGRMTAMGTNALASSVVLVCRRRILDAPTVSRRDFLTNLKAELPVALTHLQRGNIAPVDLAQAAIGPGMAVYTRYSRVLDAEGKAVTVRDALTLINQTLDEVLAEQEGDFDADTRWSLAWFEQYGFASAEYGVAETLSKAKNTSVSGLVEAGVLTTKAGKVRLLKPAELPEDWDPTTDKRLTVWEMVHHLIRVLEAGGESSAAVLAAKMGTKAEVVRELAYRLYTLCERKKRAPEALAYNALVQSWPEITRLAREGSKPVKGQTAMFEEK